MIGILLMKNDDVLISEFKTLDSEPLSGRPDYVLINPVKILGKHEEPDMMKRLIIWPDKDLTPSRRVEIYSDDVLTVVEPHDKLIEAYKELVK